ncbi:hypothetical protein Anapl_03430 [Anas platyrhynchos]|uniref:Uncharacterized protein n=1 Tax=Anas platyrhynchos TaxID=8839 RepID=R0K9E2_ANAPL|nr:hypothetical protein Anapl_03430 [Anas platyrhynchos]
MRGAKSQEEESPAALLHLMPLGLRHTPGQCWAHGKAQFNYSYTRIYCSRKPMEENTVFAGGWLSFAAPRQLSTANSTLEAVMAEGKHSRGFGNELILSTGQPDPKPPPYVTILAPGMTTSHEHPIYK